MPAHEMQGLLQRLIGRRLSPTLWARRLIARRSQGYALTRFTLGYMLSRGYRRLWAES